MAIVTVFASFGASFTRAKPCSCLLGMTTELTSSETYLQAPSPASQPAHDSDCHSLAVAGRAETQLRPSSQPASQPASTQLRPIEADRARAQASYSLPRHLQVPDPSTDCRCQIPRRSMYVRGKERRKGLHLCDLCARHLSAILHRERHVDSPVDASDRSSAAKVRVASIHADLRTCEGVARLAANRAALHATAALTEALHKTPLFFEFSLCLSRACLGKKMHFIYKWLKKWRFSHRLSDLDDSTAGLVAGRLSRAGWAAVACLPPRHAAKAAVAAGRVVVLAGGGAFVGDVEAAVLVRRVALAVAEDIQWCKPAVLLRLQTACNNVLFQLFLCLSRACLGRYSALSSYIK